MMSRLDAIVQNGDDKFGPQRESVEGVKIGEATRTQRALFTLYEQLEAAHQRIHEVTGLPYGTLEAVDAQHQKIHIMTEHVRVALAGDVTLAFPEVYGNAFDIGPDWSIYLITPRLTRWEKMKIAAAELIRRFT